MKKEAESEVMNLQAKTASTEARRESRTDSLSELPEGTNPADTLICVSDL